jgi:hypothetical protein
MHTAGARATIKEGLANAPTSSDSRSGALGGIWTSHADNGDFRLQRPTHFGEVKRQATGTWKRWNGGNSPDGTHPVGKKMPNAWGLFDMHGKVGEWCRDWYNRGYYANSPIVDPVGPATGTERVSRGGNWDYPASSCRSAHRSSSDPGSRNYLLGLRVALIPPDGQAPTRRCVPHRSPRLVLPVAKVERAEQNLHRQVARHFFHYDRLPNRSLFPRDYHISIYSIVQPRVYCCWALQRRLASDLQKRRFDFQDQPSCLFVVFSRIVLPVQHG